MNITQDITSLLLAGIAATSFALSTTAAEPAPNNEVRYNTIDVDGVEKVAHLGGILDRRQDALLHVCKRAVGLREWNGKHVVANQRQGICHGQLAILAAQLGCPPGQVAQPAGGAQ